MSDGSETLLEEMTERVEHLKKTSTKPGEHLAGTDYIFTPEDVIWNLVGNILTPSLLIYGKGGPQDQVEAEIAAFNQIVGTKFTLAELMQNFQKQ